MNLRPIPILRVAGLLVLLACAVNSGHASDPAIDGHWRRLSPPGALFGHAAVYDSRRDRMLVVGGEDGSPQDAPIVTWERSLAPASLWQKVAAGGDPPDIRFWHGAIYDSLGDRVIIVGGDNLAGRRNDCYALNLSGVPGWTNLNPAGPLPPAREGPAAILDPIANRLILFGGTSSSAVLNDVWSLNLVGPPQWTLLQPSGPAPAVREFPGAIYDPPRHRLIIFGLVQYSGPDDLWTLNLAGPPAWTPLLTTGTPPPPRVGARGVYDPAGDRLLLFGGGEVFSDPRNDLWSLSLTGMPAWTAITPPGPLPLEREFHSVILDPLRDELVLFAGYGDYQHPHLNDLWSLSLDPSSGWVKHSSGGPEKDRVHAAACVDPVRHHGILFGGIGSSGRLNDTWYLSLESGEPAWHELITQGTPPAPRHMASLILDPIMDRALLFGGLASPGGYANDTWALGLNDSTWTLVPTTGSPPQGRGAHSAVYDDAGRRMIIYGGIRSNGSTLSDVWALSLDPPFAWTQLSPTGTAPMGRNGHSAVIDNSRNRMLVFGGATLVNGWDEHHNDVWSLSLAGDGVWQMVLPMGSMPGERRFHVAAWDPLRDRMIISAGGYLTNFTGAYNDTWSLSLAGPESWTRLAPEGDGIPGDFGTVGFFDTTRNRLITHGGASFPWVTMELAFTSTVSVPDTDVVPQASRLMAWPNPMRNGVRIRVTLPKEGGRSQVDILDITGRRVRSLVDGVLGGGNHEIAWDGKDDYGAPVAAGIYFYRLLRGEEVVAGKLTIVQ